MIVCVMLLCLAPAARGQEQVSQPAAVPDNAAAMTATDDSSQREFVSADDAYMAGKQDGYRAGSAAAVASVRFKGTQEVPDPIEICDNTHYSGTYGADYDRGYREGYDLGYREGNDQAKHDKQGWGCGFGLGFFLGLIGVIIAAVM